MFIHQIVFKIQGNITGTWNMGHADLHFMTHKSNVTRLTEVRPTICLSYFHNRKVEKNLNQKLKCKIPKFVISTSQRLVKMIQHKTSDQYRTSGKVLTRFIQRFMRYRLLKTLTKTFCNANADAVVTAIALPVLSYWWANNYKIRGPMVL